MVSILYTKVFIKNARRLSKKYRSFLQDLEAFCKALSVNPDMGTSLGNGVRKIRMAVKSKGKGKSGGVRVITFNVIVNTTDTKIRLLTVYDKSEKEAISDKEIRILLDDISNTVDNLQVDKQQSED